MRRLIEDFDSDDPQRCWTWMYLAGLVGVDLAESNHYAINEEGSPYDEVGGPAYPAGDDGIALQPLDPAQDAAAKWTAEELFSRVRAIG